MDGDVVGVDGDAEEVCGKRGILDYLRLLTWSVCPSFEARLNLLLPRVLREWWIVPEFTARMVRHDEKGKERKR